MVNPYRRFGMILGDVVWYTFLFGSIYGIGLISSSLISKFIRAAIAREAMRSLDNNNNGDNLIDDDMFD
jgi:hypothetical protein